MAATSDNAVTNGRSRTSANKIVIAGDRTVSRRTARRHSNRVRFLRIGLPLTALATIVIFAVSVLQSMGVGPGVPDLQMPQIVAENLKMQNPHYEGFNADGGRYWVKAQTAQQDLKSLTIVHLNGITGELTDGKKQKTNLSAAQGLYDSKANILELLEQINVTGDSGLRASLTHATVRTKEGIITSDQPSTVVMQAGQITSNQLTVRQKTKEYTFVDTVRMHLKPKETVPANADPAAAKPLPFGKPGEPVDIASNRLDIDDDKKTALFTGGVVATQAGATLNAPELTVTYEGAIAPQGGAAPDPADSGTKVRQIVAREQVVLQQPSGETATSRTATFDTTANTAVLEGDVILTQTDKRATGDRAEYDQTGQTMVLTGPVVVTQGGNELKGRRLVFNRVTNKLQLSAPPGPAAGRISAHFVKPAASKAATDQPAEEQQPADGIPFGPTFKTDPNAPYNVLADRLDVDDTAKAAVFTGNVVATQGASTIRSLELTAFYTGNAGLAASAATDAPKTGAASLTHIQARKKVSIASKDGQTATGDWADIDVKTNLATVGGNVVLTQGNNVVRGTKLQIDMNTGQATIKTEPAGSSAGAAMISSSDGDGTGQIIKAERPSAIFYPGEMMAKKTKPAAKEADGWQVRSSP